MKKENYIIKEVKKITKKDEVLNYNYVLCLYALFSECLNYSCSEVDWINKDRVFCDDEVAIKSVAKLFGIEKYGNYNLPLSSVIGSALGANKISKLISENVKKNNILTYHNYLVCSYDLLITGDYLSAAYHLKSKSVNNVVVVAIKNSDEKATNLMNIYEECGFYVDEVKSEKVNSIASSIKEAKKQKKPCLIIINAEKEILNSSEYDYKIDFQTEFRNRTNIVYKKWLLEYDAVVNDRNEEVLDIINYLKNPKLMLDLENIEFKLDANYEKSITESSEKIFSIVKSKSKYVTLLNKTDDRLTSLIAVGLTISGLKPSVIIKNYNRVSDVVFLCKEGDFPVNFIVEDPLFDIYLPKLNVYYPCDMKEVIGSWSSVIKQNKTSVMVLSNKETTLVKNSNQKYVKYGGYMIKKEENILSGVIIASGEDVKLSLGVAGLLEKENIFMRVVTVPSPCLLLKQVKYEKELLPKSYKIFAIDKNKSGIYNKFTSSNACLLSSDLGLDKIKEKIKEELSL